MNYPMIMISVVTVLYALSSMGYFISGDWRSGLIFCGYTLANIGLLAR